MCQKFASFNFQMLQYWSSYVLHNFSPLNKEAASSKKKKKGDREELSKRESRVCERERLARACNKRTACDGGCNFVDGQLNIEKAGISALISPGREGTERAWQNEMKTGDCCEDLAPAIGPIFRGFARELERRNGSFLLFHASVSACDR